MAGIQGLYWAHSVRSIWGVGPGFSAAQLHGLRGGGGHKGRSACHAGWWSGLQGWDDWPAKALRPPCRWIGGRGGNTRHPPSSFHVARGWGETPPVEAAGKSIHHWLAAAAAGQAHCSRALLYLGSPSGTGTPSARASLGVPAFLGFCLVFLSMWTLGPAAEMIMCPGA